MESHTDVNLCLLTAKNIGRIVVILLFGVLAAAPASTFAESPLTFLTGPTAQGFAGPLALADFNRDGKLDVVQVQAGERLVKVRLGNGTGALGEPVFSYTLQNTGSGLVTAGDLNGDGIPDFAVAYGTFASAGNPGRIATFFSNGTGGFSVGPVLEAANWPGAIAVEDLNGDGVADLVIGSKVGDQLTVVLGTGGGAFAASVAYSADLSPYQVVIADFNHDGRLDIAAAAGGAGVVSVLLGIGNGTFARTASVEAGAYPVSVSVGDIDGDGWLDLVVAKDGADNLSVHYGDGAGKFSAQTALALARYPAEVLLRDVDVDGKPDLVVSTVFNGGAGSNAVYVIRNLGDRVFDDPVLLYDSGQSYIAAQHLAVGDVNGDGRPDVVVGDTTAAPPFGGGDKIRVFLGNSPTISFSPSLLTGWNLLGNSLNVMLDVAATFGNLDFPVIDLSTKIVSVWKWNAANNKWAFYSPQLSVTGIASYAAGKGYDVLATIDAGEGYWVNALEPIALPPRTGASVSWSGIGFAALPSGWNLIATAASLTPHQFNWNVSISPPTPGLVPIDNFISLWAWDAANLAWYFYAPSLEVSGNLGSYITGKGYLDFTATGKTLGPGVGFWANKP